jgi:hypothetical protein
MVSKRWELDKITLEIGWVFGKCLSAAGTIAMLEKMLGEEVVVDLRSHYVCLGTLEAVHELYLELRDADLHDLRDTRTSRENHIAASLSTGIKRNRRRLLLVRADVVAISRTQDVVDE